MITLYNSCVRKFIYLQNFQTFTIYTATAVVVILERRFGDTHQSISHHVTAPNTKEYLRILTVAKDTEIKPRVYVLQRLSDPLE